MKRQLTLLALLTAASVNGQSVVSFTGGYAQNFDGLDDCTQTASTFPYYAAADLNPYPYPVELAGEPFISQGMEGWYVRNTKPARLAYRVYGMEGVGAGYINFGLTTDRALGLISNGTTAIPQLGVVLRNDTDAVISEIPVSFAGEQWRGPGIEATLKFSYQVLNEPAIDTEVAFTEPGGNFDFTASGYGYIEGDTEGHVAGLGGMLTGLDWNPGEYLVLRWTNSTTTTGLAIDDLIVGETPPEYYEWAYFQLPYLYLDASDQWFFLIGDVWAYDYNEPAGYFMLAPAGFPENAVPETALGYNGWVALNTFPYPYSATTQQWFYISGDVQAVDLESGEAVLLLTAE